MVAVAAASPCLSFGRRGRGPDPSAAGRGAGRGGESGNPTVGPRLDPEPGEQGGNRQGRRLGAGGQICPQNWGYPRRVRFAIVWLALMQKGSEYRVRLTRA
jgi:hypothetical protein